MFLCPSATSRSSPSASAKRCCLMSTSPRCSFPKRVPMCVAPRFRSAIEIPFRKLVSASTKFPCALLMRARFAIAQSVYPCSFPSLTSRALTTSSWSWYASFSSKLLASPPHAMYVIARLSMALKVSKWVGPSFSFLRIPATASLWSSFALSQRQ